MDNFFKINMPRGMVKNSNGQWTLFNREFLPLGHRPDGAQCPSVFGNSYLDLPIHHRYIGATEELLIKLSENGGELDRREADNSIYKVQFYTQNTNPTVDPYYWDSYFNKIKLLGELKRF